MQHYFAQNFASSSILYDHQDSAVYKDFGF